MAESVIVPASAAFMSPRAASELVDRRRRLLVLHVVV